MLVGYGCQTLNFIIASGKNARPLGQFCRWINSGLEFGIYRTGYKQKGAFYWVIEGCGCSKNAPGIYTSVQVRRDTYQYKENHRSSPAEYSVGGETAGL